MGAALRPGVPAVLLANHGVLVFHRTPELAVLVGGVVEEAAQAAINASPLGGPVAIPADLRAAALQRAMAFAAAGDEDGLTRSPRGPSRPGHERARPGCGPRPRAAI